MTDKYTARANDVLAALDVWIKENRDLPDTGLEGQAFLKAAIAAALQAAHDEGVERVARELDKWGWKGDADDIRALKHADRRGDGGGA